MSPRLSEPCLVLLIQLFHLGTASYVHHIAGDTDLILTIPHGGDVKPSGWPERRYGCKDSNDDCVYGAACLPENESSGCYVGTFKDRYTQEIGFAIRDYIEANYPFKPHVIYSDVHRSRLDMNREILQGAQGFPAAEATYNEYHDKIAEVKAGLGSRGLLIDLHGQAHGQNSTEIGYLLAYWRLMKVYNLGVNYSSYKNRLGMRRLFLEQGSSVDLETFIFGANSFGALLQSQGYDALPGPDFPSSSTDDYAYYSGGYTIQTHGSGYSSANYDSNTDGLQLEFPGEMRVSDTTIRTPYAEALARAIGDFYTQYYL